ncbi:MAG: DUF5119 domain-containing protein [Muribaculaceae bacterium]|nr:DUF5119 domain-containing protein [Muribaculaceae bacterium]
MLMAGLMATSCRHKDLYMDEPMSTGLQVVFDWRDAPEANPASMAMYLYENDGNKPLRYIFDNPHGGEIKAPFGIRHAICMNADNSDWAALRNHENIETFEIYTQDIEDLGARSLPLKGIPRAEGTESERLASAPHMLWGSRTNNISINPHTGTQTITLYPHEAICYYTVDVLDVDNLDGLSGTTVDATLSGLAEAYNFGADAPSGQQATMPFVLHSGSDGSSLHGEYLTFGETPGYSGKHFLTVYMVLADGSKWWHAFDVTDQVSDAPDPKHVHIVVRGLPLPEPPSGSGTSLTPDVNEWQAVNVDLHM